jgi:hypothetical protein
LLREPGEVDVDTLKVKRATLLRRGVSHVWYWQQDVTYDHKCGLLFILPAEAEVGLDSVPDVGHCDALLCWRLVGRVWKECMVEEDKNYERSRKVSVFENAEKLSLVNEMSKTNAVNSSWRRDTTVYRRKQDSSGQDKEARK